MFHAIAVNIVLIDDHIARVDPDPNFDPSVSGATTSTAKCCRSSPSDRLGVTSIGHRRENCSPPSPHCGTTAEYARGTTDSSKPASSTSESVSPVQ
jgi:hypothetical protein